MYKLEPPGFPAWKPLAGVEEILGLEWADGAAREEGKNKQNLFIKHPEQLQWKLMEYVSAVRNV